MKVSPIYLSGLLVSASCFGHELLPPYWLENVTATDGSTQECLVFQSTAGVNYRVEVSEDLKTWNTQWELYGMGHEFVVPMREVTPPASGPSTPSAPCPVVSVCLQKSSGSAGGTVASWLSLSDRRPITVLLAGEMAAAWSSVPMFIEKYDGYLIPVTHPSHEVFGSKRA